MTPWEDIEKEPEYASLNPQDRASLFDEWKGGVLSAAAEEDPETIDPDGISRFIATSNARRRSLGTGEPFDENTALKEYSASMATSAADRNRKLAVFQEAEKAKFDLMDAEATKSGALGGFGVPNFLVPDAINRPVEEAGKKLAEVNAKLPPEQMTKAGEALEALRGGRPTAVLDGELIVDPSLTLNSADYREAVKAADVSPEAKARALAAFQQNKKQFLQASLSTLRAAGDAPIPGMESFADWESELPREEYAKTPEEKAAKYLREMKDRGWFRKLTSAIGTALIQGGADIATQGIGAAAMATGDPALAEEASQVAQGTEIMGEASRLEGDLSATGATTAAGVARMAVPIAPVIGAAALTGGGLPVAAAMSGLQTAGSQFPGTYSALREQGKTEEEALAAARGSALISGAVTSALTAAGGATGIEGLLRTGGQAAVRSRLLTALKAVPGGAIKELPEELTDELISQIVEQQTVAPDKPISQTVDEFLAQAPDLALQVAILGGAGEAVSAARQPLLPTVATPPPVQPATADVAANVAATDEGEVAPIVTPDVGTPVTLDGQNYTVSIPPGSPISPDALAGFFDDPETLRALHESGRIRLEQVIAPTETVDTTPLNNNVAASAAFVPQVTKAMTEIADEEAAAPAVQVAAGQRVTLPDRSIYRGRSAVVDSVDGAGFVSATTDDGQKVIVRADEVTPEAVTPAAVASAVAPPSNFDSRNKEMLPEQDDFGGKFDTPLRIKPDSYTNKDGIETVEYTNPDTGVVDVYISAFGNNDFIAYMRVYDEQGNPTNRWTSKLERRTDRKGATKAMLTELQSRLPANHQYAEDVSVSTDGLRFIAGQLQQGYTVAVNPDGTPQTTEVAISGESIVNDLPIPVDPNGRFENVRVSRPADFAKVRDYLGKMLQGFGVGLNSSNVRWENGTVLIDLPVLQRTSKPAPLSEGAERNRAVVAEAAAKLRSKSPNGVSAGLRAAIPQPAVTPAQETPVAPAESDGGSLGQMTPAAGGSSPDVTAATVPQEPVVSSAEIAPTGDPFVAPITPDEATTPPPETVTETPTTEGAASAPTARSGGGPQPAQPSPVVGQPPTPKPAKRKAESRRAPRTIEDAEAAIAEQSAAAEFVSDLRAEGQEARVRQKKAAFITESAEGRREPAFLQQLLSGGWDKALDDVQRGLVTPERAEKLAKDAEASGLLDTFTANRFSRQPAAPQPPSPKPVKPKRPKKAPAPPAAEVQQQPIEETPAAPTPLAGPLRPKFVAGETVSFKVNGQPVMGTIQRVSGGGSATVTYNWNGKKDQEIVLRTSQIQRPVLAVAEEPNYKYTQEQNARKAARFGLPTEPGVTVGAGPVIKNALARIASDTAMPQMLRAVARALQNQNYDGVDLRIEADGRRWYAGYYLNDNGITEIGINLRLVGRGQVDAISVLLHEALHHVTLAKVRDPQGEIETQAVEALDTLRKRIKVFAGLQQKATKFSYELGTVDEFITALFTRPDFQDFIAGVPDTFTPGTPGSKFRSALSEIFRIIAQLVTGQKVQKGGILDQSFASTLALFETPQRAARGQSVDYTPSGRVAYADLPDDMQVLIADLSKDGRVMGTYDVVQVSTSSLPAIPFSPRDRGEEHAKAMVGKSTPPILLSGDKILDGRHRIAAARMAGLPSVPAIDIGENESDADVIGRVSPASRQSATDDTTTTEPVFTPDEARAILTKRFGKAVADKFNIEVMAPRRMGNREVEVDAELRGGTISLNLKFMDSEELLIQKAEHEMAHAVFSDKGVQDAWRELSASMPPDVRTRITERMSEAGYDYRVLNEEVLVRFLEEVRASTSPSKWKAFMDAVIDAFRRFFGAMPDARTARLAAARIVAAGEAAVARGLDPSKQAFGQSVATPRGYAFQRNLSGEAATMKNLVVRRPWKETLRLAREIIEPYKKEDTSKDKMIGREKALRRLMTDTDIDPNVRTAGLMLLALEADTLASVAKTPEDQARYDDFANIPVNAYGVLESSPDPASVKLESVTELMQMGSEAGRLLNSFKLIAAMSPDGFVRRQNRVWKKKVNEATEQQFGTTNVMSEIEKLWRMMQEAGATDRGLAIAAALKAFMPSRKNAAALIAKLFPQAGIRDRMTKGGEALVRDFFQMVAGPRDPKGPLAEFDESIQSALSSMLRKVMEARGLVADNQTVQATDIDKLVRSVSADPLRFDKIAAADAAMQDELAKIEDDERRATLQQAWEEATSKMYTNVANDATLRRAVNAELKGEGVKWNEMFDKGQKPAAIRARVVDAVMTKVGALLTDPTDSTVKANLDMLRSEVGAAFDFIAETKRVQWLAYRAGVEARRRVAERRKDMLAALRNRGVAESALMRLNEKMAGPQRPGAEPNAVTTLIGEHIKTPVDGFIDKLVALGVDQSTAEALDAISGTVRADLAKLAEANAVKRLTESLKPKTRAAKSAIPRLLRVLLEAGKTGAFDSKAFNDALGEAFDFPPMTAEQEAEIKRMVTEINKLPQGAARVDKQQELQNYVALVQGVPARDMLLSALYANWLSGLSTQAIGLAGNSANMGLRSFFLFLTSHPEDFANYLRGALGAGLRAGAMEAKASLGSFSKWAKNEPEQVRGQFKVGKLDNPEIANALEVLLRKGPSTPAEWVAYVASFGTRMRAVFRVMTAIDTLFWNSAREGMYHLAASRTARKTAKEKGMTKEEANAEFIRQLGGGPEVFEAALKDAEAELKKAGQPADMLTMTRMAYEAIDKARVEANPEAVAAANRFAFRMVLQQEPEGSGKLISKLISVLQKELNVAGFPLGQMLVPYNKIVSNLFEQSLDYTGLGLVRAALGMHISDARIDWSRKGMPGISPREGATMFSETEARERAMAGFVGLTLSAAAYVAAKANMDDDDDEVPFMIYAFGPTNKNKRDQMPDGWSPFSIKIGNTYYRYAEWPLGMVLAGFGAALDAERYGNMKEKDTLDRIGYSAMLGLKGFMTQGVLSNVDTAIDVIMFKATGKKYTDIPINAAKGLIPAQGALRDISRMFDNTKISNDDVASALIKDIPVVKSWGTKPELNVFGEPVMQDGVAVLSRFVTQRRPHAEADYLTRNKLYIPGMDETVTIGQYLPPTERDRFKRRAMQMDAMENGVFTAEQNYNFRKRAGELTKSAVQRVMKQAPAVRTDEQRKAVQNLIDKQVGVARRRAMVEAVPYQPPPAQ